MQVNIYISTFNLRYIRIIVTPYNFQTLLSRKYIVGRSNIAEKLARCVFGGNQESERSDIGTTQGLLTLTGYKEVPSSRDRHIAQ